MKLLLVKQAKAGPYRRELNAAVRSLKGQLRQVGLKGLTVDYLARHGIDVVLSNRLPPETYYLLKGMNVVTITVDKLERYQDYADIVIDRFNKNPNKYFTGPASSFLGKPDFDLAEVAGLIKRLAWDSDFFGFNVAYLSCMHLTDNIYARIERFIQQHQIKLVEYLCNCHDSRSVNVAEKNGFHFADIRLTFARKLGEAAVAQLPAGIGFKKAGQKDIARLRKISSGIYKDSRYFFDQKFDPLKAREFYQNWVEKGVLGTFDHECWCLYDANGPFAFCTIRYGARSGASIGLFGMAARYQGRGLGKQLLSLVFNVLREKGIANVSVVTQGRNYAAQRLYQSVGFKTKTTQLWYHKWL
jgi:dTDP-4-amino-4,6-dideoxy-D-galactose acyltransferase